jgi:hypothetical protein
MTLTPGDRVALAEPVEVFGLKSGDWTGAAGTVFEVRAVAGDDVALIDGAGTRVTLPARLLRRV